MSSPDLNFQPSRVPHATQSHRGAWVRRKLPPLALIIAILLAASARATLPPWLQHIIAASTFESALFRSMHLPGVEVLYPRPPKESQAELAKLNTPDPELFQIKARTDESALDLAAAEADWKLYAAHAKDPIAARFTLADFYHRQLAVSKELATLREIASSAPSPADQFLNPSAQPAWRAFTRIFALIADHDLPAADSAATYGAFLTRYPAQPSVYARAFEFSLAQHDFPAAEALIPRFRKQFPQEETFPIRAQALLEYRRGHIDAALAVYDRSFQPLWPSDLLASYYALLAATHRQRLFVADARARLALHPDGPEALNALARIFYYDSLAQPQAHPDQAQQTLDAFRIAREARNGQWTPTDLYTLAALEQSTSNYAEQARYSYALTSLPETAPALLNGESPAQSGLAALIEILLDAPEEPLPVGAGNLTLYRDIATLDQGPGYWNGILSLWLNGTSPQNEYQAETGKAQSYFHRSKAAELLAELDRRFPNAPQRPYLHAQLISALTQYGEPAAVVAASEQFLAAFPNAPERLQIVGFLADAYARQQDTASEFALYDALLNELSAHSNGLPLSAASAPARAEPPAGTPAESPPPTPSPLALSYFIVPPEIPGAVDASAYSTILDRYIARLTATQRLPQALAVLRRQLDRNPSDPLLYERLATFLQQNNLTAGQEELYKQAIARFQQPGWYDKLARLYLRQRNQAAFSGLTRQVTGIFSGTELEAYFARVNELRASSDAGPQLALQLNLYAAQRFPHDLVFTRNLLNAYQARPTANPAAYEALLRHHWYEDGSLREEFFALLSRTNKLDAELASLQPLAQPGAPSIAASPQWVGSTTANPAATRELAEIHLWTSHFESAAPLLSALATLYPADPSLDDRAVSVFRSLAYLDPTPASTNRAVAIETNLLTALPDDPDRLATLGDLYAEATSTGGEDLQTAAPYWRRIPTLHPGTPAGFLTSATIFWDYFQFDDALAELNQARTRFHQPALYGYEAGAIQENRHDLPAAIREYTAACVHPDPGGDSHTNPPTFYEDEHGITDYKTGNNQAHARLLQLAIRSATRTLVDAASAKSVAENPASTSALTLRADILIARHREPELAPLFTAALTHAATGEQAASLATLAQSHALTPVYESAVARQVALASDPVQKLELQYTLAGIYESHKQIPAAQSIIASVYAVNPRILGVVRATTDFYARTAQPKAAIATLLEAAKDATPTLARSFTLEAAGKANDSGDTAQARSLALTLLSQTPYDPQVLALLAASYARANDNQELKTFYLAQLDKARTDPTLTSADRKADTALLRRGLIPALTRLNDFSGATDQYIALLSAYPEDSGTASEAALYALRHDRQSQLVGFLQATVKASPRDSRFAILLAETESTFEDLPAALAALNAAIAIRKDRAVLYQARVDLELRLNQPEPAAADYQRLYLLTYKDPQWMVRLAELRARQGRPADAVQALTTAYIEGRPKSPANFFNVAAQLESWNLLAEARTFAQQGIDAAGPQLLLSPDASAGPATYARILTRFGRPGDALATLDDAQRSAEAYIASPAALAAGLAHAQNEDPDGEPISDRDTADLRKSFLEQQRALIQTRLNQALAALGATVQIYDTPEQKLAYARQLDTLHATNVPLAIAAASSAGLADREAAWRRQLLLTAPLSSQGSNLATYVSLQQHRLAFSELAQTLESYAARFAPGERNSLREQAAQAFRNAGDAANELRLTRTLALSNDPTLRDRFLDLVLHRDPAALTALAAGKDATLADAAANYAVAHGTLSQASAAISARGKSFTPLWTNASFALAGLFLTPHSPDGAFAPTPPPVRDAFTSALRADASIADRLANPSNPTTTLTGDLWFSYASRFGIALLLGNPTSQPPTPDTLTPEDFLPADLERSPTRPSPYLQLARTYAESNRLPQAVTEYNHALELAPNSPSTYDEIALLQFRAGNRPAALDAWRAAFAILAHMVERNNFPEAFYTSFSVLLQHLGQRFLTAQFHPEIESILRPFFARNGNYRSNELLQSVYTASATPAEGTAFLLSLSTASPVQDLILSNLYGASWLPPEAQIALFERRLQLASQTPVNSGNPSQATDNGVDPATNLHQIQQILLGVYISYGQDAQAQTLLDTLAADPVQAKSADVQRARVLLAAHSGKLAPLVASWRVDPEAAPTPDILSAAANTLAASRPEPDPPSLLPTTSNSRSAASPRQPDPASARLLREFAFDQKQLGNALLPTDFLALAQSRIATNDLPGALDLLHRLALRPPASAHSSAEATAYGNSAPYPDPGSYADSSPSAESSPYASSDPYANLAAAARLLESTHHQPEAVPFLTTLVQSVPWNAGFRLRLAQAQLTSSSDKPKAIPGLVLIAKDSAAPYEVRTEAAQTLAAQSAPTTDLGSAELTLLATSPHPSAQLARQPYFVAARLAAASTTATFAADARLTLLREAIAIAPTGLPADSARLTLLQLEAASPNPAEALAILRTLQSTPYSAPGAAANADTNDSAASEASDDNSANPDADSSDPSPATLPAIALTLDLPSRIHLAADLASAFHHDDGPAESLLWLLLAVQLDAGSPHPDPALQTRLRTLKLTLQLDRRNALRIPVLGKELNQPNHVRPRITLAQLSAQEAP